MVEFIFKILLTRFSPISANSEQKPVEVFLTEKNEQTRQKRQFGFKWDELLNFNLTGFLFYSKISQPGFGQSSALANANAFNQYGGPGGFGANSALAGAQSFNSQGPLGGFGASAANSASQGFNVGPGGISENAGFSGSQSYNLPGGHNINLAYGESFK